MAQTFSEVYNKNERKRPFLVAAFSAATKKLGISAEITDDYGCIYFSTKQDSSRRDELWAEVTKMLNDTPISGTVIASNTHFIDSYHIDSNA